MNLRPSGYEEPSPSCALVSPRLRSSSSDALCVSNASSLIRSGAQRSVAVALYECCTNPRQRAGIASGPIAAGCQPAQPPMSSSSRAHRCRVRSQPFALGEFPARQLHPHTRLRRADVPVRHWRGWTSGAPALSMAERAPDDVQRSDHISSGKLPPVIRSLWAAGMRMVKVEPQPTTDSTSSVPLCASTSDFAMARPSPLPPCVWLRAPSTR